jgi:hypothetical protein
VAQLEKSIIFRNFCAMIGKQDINQFHIGQFYFKIGIHH